MFARLSTAVAGACLLLATPAVAQDGVSLSVETADLDLASDAGRAQLDRRIRKAATQLCDNGSTGLPMQMAYQVCRNEVISSGGRQATQLASLKNGRIQLARNTR